ncbi:MAG TPA: hypothetical protein VFE93_15235 [Myxococcaceae bacterium]|nr:hypothetical protein [Myxococcaceae bacterium]
MLSLGLGSAALAQTSVESSTVTKQTVRTGVIQTISGNKVTVKEASGVREVTVPDGFKFQVSGQDVGLDQLKPGMTVTAVITDQVTTRDVTVTKVVRGTVKLVTPGGFVVLDPHHNYVSYNFTDKDGNDLYYVAADGQEDSLRDVKVGDQLTGTIITKFPPQVVDKRTITASAVAPPPPPAPPAVAVATPSRKLPRTASPLPLVGLLGALSAGIALTLRGARTLF